LPPPDDGKLRNLIDVARKAIVFTERPSHKDLENDELLRLDLTKLSQPLGMFRVTDRQRLRRFGSGVRSWGRDLVSTLRWRGAPGAR
jgi:hypothetical protein